MQPQVAPKWLFSTTPQIGEVSGVGNSISHATQLLLTQGMEMRDRRRGHRLATCCSRPTTGALLAHPVVSAHPFTGTECAYYARVAGGFIRYHPARSDSTCWCVSPRECVGCFHCPPDRSCRSGAAGQVFTTTVSSVFDYDAPGTGRACSSVICAAISVYASERAWDRL